MRQKDALDHNLKKEGIPLNYIQSSPPNFIYGTAWKAEATADLVKLAISAGFSAIDTANQKKHYREDYVGVALKELFENGLERSSLFLQSKFTFVQGQDHRIPYDPDASFAEQVRASFRSTLSNLHTDYLDSFLLHGPLSRSGMTDGDWEVWQEMEALYDDEMTLAIGLSNVSGTHLRQVIDLGKVKPSYVQNRCFAVQGWDHEVRSICRENDILYQGFSLLTANQQVLEDARIQMLADRHEVTPEQIIFRASQQMGMIPLTGTSNEKHMRQDLSCCEFELSDSEMVLIETISG